MPKHPPGSAQNNATFWLLKRNMDINTEGELTQDPWWAQGILKHTWQPGVSKKCIVPEDHLNLYMV